MTPSTSVSARSSNKSVPGDAVFSYFEVPLTLSKGSQLRAAHIRLFSPTPPPTSSLVLACYHHIRTVHGDRSEAERDNFVGRAPLLFARRFTVASGGLSRHDIDDPPTPTPLRYIYLASRAFHIRVRRGLGAYFLVKSRLNVSGTRPSRTNTDI